MTTTKILTFSIHRTLDDTTFVAGVGAGIVDVDDMSWDERLLATTTWRDEVRRRYMPPTDTVYFIVHDDTGSELWEATGPFPLAITPTGGHDARPDEDQ